MFLFWVWFDLVYFLYGMAWHIPVVRFVVNTIGEHSLNCWYIQSVYSRKGIRDQELEEDNDARLINGDYGRRAALYHPKYTMYDERQLLIDPSLVQHLTTIDS